MISETSYKITEECPCRCTFCDSYVKYNEILKKKVISLNEWQEITNKLVKQGLEAVVISGGEPLLRPQVTLELIPYLRERGIYVVLNTSAVLFSQKDHTLINKVIDAKPDLIVFSIDSVDEQKHNANRNMEGLYEKVISSITYLKDHSTISVGIRTVITRRNYNDLPEIITKFARLGVDCIKLTHIENDVDKEFVLTVEDLRHFNSRIRAEMISAIQQLKLEDVLKEENIKKINSIFPDERQYENISNALFSPEYCECIQCCLQGRFFAIQSNGDVLPCCEAEHHYYPLLGNMLVMSVEEIVASSEYDKFKSHRPEYCRYCTQMQNIQLSFDESTRVVERR